jgi:CheY-like chemotaxis protein
METEQKPKIKIMLVDDDNFLLEMYARKFTNSGYEVLTATSAEDALNQIMSNGDLDIILSDIIMPEMDGLELLSKISEENYIPKAFKIVLSNQGQQVEIDKAEELGISGYIIKALHTPSEVVKKVQEIMANKK